MSGSTKVVGVTATLIALITLFVSVRVFVRSFIFRSVDWDDVLVFLSYALTITLCSCVLAMTSFGFGTPIADVSNDAFRQFLKFQFVTQLTYVWGVVMIKMSFAVLYLRLLPGHFSRRLNQLLIIVFAAEAFASTIVVILHCKPLDKMWNPEKAGKCLDLRPFYYSIFAIKLVTDICLFIQPIPPIWKLQLSKEKRLGVISMLSIGLFVCIIAVIRITTIGSLGEDVTESLVQPMIWSQVEVCALIICAAIPSFPPFFRCFPALSKAMGLSSIHESEDSFPPSDDILLRHGHPHRDTSGITQQNIPQRHAGPDGVVITQSGDDDLCVYRPVI